jgi:superfamily I DNA and/or RNA helicase
VFCTASSGSLHFLKEKYKFSPDLIILDEAAQVVEPISWQILLLVCEFL